MYVTSELTCQYDSRQSFYGKAHIIQTPGRITLQSYTTDVAYIEDGRLVVKGKYSTTTARHIREFMKQYGFMKAAQMPWAQVLEQYGPDAPAQPHIDEDGTVVVPAGTAPALTLFG